jgi:2-polyprenyl-3-methyl-5-hydroxy-6-metoxy-1,4-benzoquinol methylase
MRNLRLSFQSHELGQVLFANSSEADRLLDYDIVLFQEKISPNFYSEFYSQASNPLAVTRNIQFKSIIKILAPFFNTTKKTQILDIGCGQGDFVNLIQKMHSSQVEAYGIEPSISQETERIKKLTLETLPVSENLPKSYDILTLFDVFEHFANPTDCLNQLSQLLNKEGHLVLMVPNKDSLLYRLGKVLVPVLPKLANLIFARLYQITYPPPHHYYYNTTSLTALLRPLFEVKFIGYESQLPLKGIPTRFWGVNPILKPFLIVAAVFYRLLSPNSLNDSLVLIAKKRPKPLSQGLINL